MTLANLTHGPASEVAEWLHQAQSVEKTDLLAALINALRRIDTLEKQLKATQQPSHQPEWLSQALNEGDGSYKP